MCVGWIVLDFVHNKSCLEHLVGSKTPLQEHKVTMKKALKRYKIINSQNWLENESTKVLIQSVLQLTTISLLLSVKITLVTSNTSKLFINMTN